MAPVSSDVHAVAPDVVVEFFQKIMPFKELDEATQRDIARHVRVDFYPKGTRLLTAGETEITHLYLIQKGGVKAFITDDEGEVTLKDYRGEGSYIGALGIIRGTRANLHIETVEDTFCFLLPREVFLELLHSQPGFAQYYLKSFSEKVVHTAYSELRRHKMTRRGRKICIFSPSRLGISSSRIPARWLSAPRCRMRPGPWPTTVSARSWSMPLKMKMRLSVSSLTGICATR
ncbi:hypothetical protein GF1_25310 [Desulfolithobacter dissulfuricans]|uniref:Cyclic nucleotide-binding domain-containing protein n=1 Tax=Desulfolithobacter dissulfuricans TaxID=2795293 RepID=A0A915U3G0_9BACT|nr:hypothetical protein GF1_25310 [Desulfolithobacter dissulfuricans]